MEKFMEKYEEWITDNFFDDTTRRELENIRDNEQEIQDRFFRELDFGTGGLRGIIGAGTNRMNKYTVRKATQGLANYILKTGGKDKGVAIAYDSRIMSPEFAEIAALCLNANGIKTYRFTSLRPTPELSFAVRELGCIAGIVITASHNPAEYNGYKVYWEDGAQITPPRDKEIIDEVNSVGSYKETLIIDKNTAIKNNLYKEIDKLIDDRYIEELKKLSINKEIIKKLAKDLRIVYTPLHGTGNIPVRRVLQELGFEHVFVVPEQEQPDGMFRTVDYPNPEDPNAFKLALNLAKKENADIILATDPDADRLGVYAKDRSGDYISFTGNMSGVLIADYILSQRKKNGQLPANSAVVTTIVTTDLLPALAEDYHVKCIEVLTGFKYIGEQIKLFEDQHSYEYIFGMEESYGCLVGTHARDKDAVSAVMALCEVAAYCKSQNLTLWDRMLELYEEFGYYREKLVSKTLKGIEGLKKIEEIMEKLRTNTPTSFGKFNVLAIRDYLKNQRKDFQSGEVTSTSLPKSNVLYFELSGGAWCCVRPSGTEPKIKFYIGTKGESLDDADKKLKELTACFLGLV